MTRPTHNVGNRFRQKRMAKFLQITNALVDAGEKVSILDLGGTIDYWKALPGLYQKPRVEITVVNLGCTEMQLDNLIRVDGNACKLTYPDMAFDVVHSNSVIEHVGRWNEMAAMAVEVRRLAPRYFVQTPNMWFPMEPHFKLPFVHWLPEALRLRLVASVGRAPQDIAGATRAVQSISLIDARQMKTLFPDAEIWHERWMGFSKSLVAIKANPKGSSRCI